MHGPNGKQVIIAKYPFLVCFGHFVFNTASLSRENLILIQVPNPSFFRVLLPRLGWCSKSTLCLFDKVQSNQSKAICLINNPSLTKSLQPRFHRRLVEDLSMIYRHFRLYCSEEIRDTIPVPLRRVRTTKSKTPSHPFQVSLPTSRTLSHKSSFIPRTCNLWNVLPSSCLPESCNFPSFKSNINQLDLIYLSS